MDKRRVFFIIFILVVIWLVSGIFANIFLISTANDVDPYSNVALIKINSEITTEGSYGSVSSSDVVSLMEEYSSYDNIEAIIIEINSPGGSAVASKEIVDEIKKLRSDNLTVVSYIRDIGASGAYWISSSTEKIFSSELSLVGSIGVTSSFLEFSGLLRKYNVTYEQLIAGKYKDIGSPFREMTDEERQILEKQLNLVYEIFLRDVARNRNMTYDQIKSYADGKVYLGIEAEKFGLVDGFGGKSEAIDYVSKKIGSSVVLYERQEEDGLFSIFEGIVSAKMSPTGLVGSSSVIRT